MDDLRTKETLDALADLFLTGTTPAKPTPPVRIPPRKSGDGAERPTADLTPTVVVKQDVLDSMPPAQNGAGRAPAAPTNPVLSELDGPGSYSLGTPNTSAARYDDNDAPPAVPLKLRDVRQQDDDGVVTAAQPAHVEAVFLGNLPGFGGPWLTQYAFHLAQQRGPVAVLHVIGDRVDLELVTAERQSVRTGVDEPIAPGAHADAQALIHRLERLAGDAARPVATWLIHLPSPTDPTQLPRAAAIDHWTLLCGGDDMAIAAATRLLQTLFESTTQPSGAAKVTGVMIMGSDEAKAREAIDKFNAAATGFLRQPVELIGSRKQMTPVHMRPLGGCGGADIWPAVHAFLETLPTGDEPAQAAAGTEPTAMTPPPAPAPAGAAASRPTSPPSEPPVYDHASAVIEPPSEIEHLTRVAAPTTRPQVPVAQAASAESAAAPSTSPRSPKPAAAAELPRPAVAAAFVAPSLSSVSEPDLSALLTAPGGALAGGVALQARYPKQPDTQILLDQQGRLHLCRRQVAADLRSALVDLMEARDWLREHIELVALTQRQCKFDTAAEPILHLFTADAKHAVALVSKLGPSVKLHLLQEVRIGAARTWVCNDLN